MLQGGSGLYKFQADTGFNHLQTPANVYNFYKITNQTSYFWAHLQYCEEQLLTSSFLSAWNNLAPTGQILMKFDI
jgi:hypothetical protein